MSILLKFLYLYQHFPVLISKKFFAKVDRMISDFLWGSIPVGLRKSILQLPKQMQGFALPIFVYYYWKQTYKNFCIGPKKPPPLALLRSCQKILLPKTACALCYVLNSLCRSMILALTQFSLSHFTYWASGMTGVSQLLKICMIMVHKQTRDRWERDLGPIGDDKWDNILDLVNNSICTQHGLIQSKLLHRV